MTQGLFKASLSQPVCAERVNVQVHDPELLCCTGCDICSSGFTGDENTGSAEAVPAG